MLSKIMRMHAISLRSIFASLVLAMCAQAQAQSAASEPRRTGPHIAIVDIGRVIKSYPVYTNYEKTVQTSVEAAKKQAEAQEAELTALDKQRKDMAEALKSLPKDSAKRKASEEALLKKNAEVEMKIDQLNRFRQNSAATLTNDLKSQAVQAANTIIEFVSKYAPEKGSPIVLNLPSATEAQARQGTDVIVGIDKLREEAKDITDDVIKALEKR